MRLRGRGRIFKPSPTPAKKSATVEESSLASAATVRRNDLRTAVAQQPAAAEASPEKKQLPCFDERSAQNIATLNPEARPLALRWLSLVREQGIPAVIIVGTRTLAEQSDLYAQGRTKPGAIITNAKPGSSKHNYGAAWDYVVFEAITESGGVGQPMWNSTLMDRAGELAESLGLVWGGRFKKMVDKPHVELPATLASLRSKYPSGFVGF